MRDREWRRNIEEKWVKKRIHLLLLNKLRWYWQGQYDINGFYIPCPKLKDYIGGEENFMYKTHSSDSYTSKNKVKYSPNKSKPYHRDGKKRFETREFKKLELLKILKENGLI